MHYIEFFYSKEDLDFDRNWNILKGVVGKRKDMVLLAFDVDTEAGIEKAMKRGISEVPTTIIDGKTFIRGAIHSKEQILSRI